MDVETRVEGDITVVRLCDARLDAAAAVRFKEQLRDVSDGGADKILIDMSEVVFMDSSGLGAVVTVMKLMGQKKSLMLASLTPAVAKVFALTRMDKVFRIFMTLEEALDAERV